MKFYIGLFSLLLSTPSFSNDVVISAQIDTNDLVLSLTSDTEAIHRGGHKHFYINTDNDNGTGYSNGNITGADFLIQDGYLYSSLTNSSNWGWRYVKNIGFYPDEIPKYYDLNIPLSLLSINHNSTITVGVNALSSSWNTLSSYHGTKMKELPLSGNSPNSGNGTGNNSNSTFLRAYNQAYIENDDNADSIYDITQANNAYILVDPFGDSGNNSSITSIFQLIKDNHNQLAGYISVGTAEDWRNDFSQLAPPIRTSEEWSEWPGEYFINETNSGALDVMKARIDKIASWGLDWVEFDNMDWSGGITDYNLAISSQEAIDYVNDLCDYAHSQGVKCMAKNTVQQFSRFDGVTYESWPNSLKWWEGGEPNGTSSFLTAGKPVIIFHYGSNKQECDSSYNFYQNTYGSEIHFSCEVGEGSGYIHYSK